MRKASLAAALILGLGAVSMMSGCLLAAAGAAGAGAGYIAGQEGAEEEMYRD